MADDVDGRRTFQTALVRPKNRLAEWDASNFWSLCRVTSVSVHPLVRICNVPQTAVSESEHLQALGLGFLGEIASC